MVLVAGLAVGCTYRHDLNPTGVGGAGGGAAGADATGTAGVDGGPGGAAGDEGPTDADGGGDRPTQLLANGVPCGRADQCASNQCVDGVCCESACSGQCQACAEAGSAGSCVNVTGKPRGTVRAVCAGSGPCAAQCNGSDGVACHYPGGEVQCADATCAAGVAHPPSFCDRAGACAMSAAVNCTSNQCADASQCSGGCSATQPCGSGMYCDATTRACLAQKQTGAACAADQECTSTFCTDNVCCGSRCSGQCQACAETGKLGMCATISGTPRGTVRQACAGAGMCASRCDGTDATQCKYPGSTVQCTAASCSSGVSTAPTVCNGSGACTAPTQTPCTSNQCSDAMHCSSGCSAALPCPNGQYCDSQAACQPIKPTGSSCSADVQCASGACTDNVCCESRCSGQCQACAEPGMAGKCLTVSGTPRGMRTACTGMGTCASRCDGSDPTQCRFPGSSVQCTPQTCSAGVVKPPSVCNGSGACTMPASMPCTSNLCADTMTCSGGCSASQPCPSNQYCDPASKACLNLKTNGTACGADLECSSAACTDGVCCNSRCSGQCEACAETGKVGTCSAVSGVPRGNVRQPCAGTRDTCRGQCDGATRTQCAYPAGNIQCVAASCMNGTLTTASVCNGLGDCTAQTTGACHSTQCLSTTACLDNCSASAPCSGTNYCDANGVCRPQIGSGACTADAQCLSGHCVDGVCCNSACNDGCHGCNLAGSVGTCISRFTQYSPIQGTAFESVPITVGPDGNLWFLEEGATGISFMGRITAAGAITEFSVTGVERAFITSGADGTIWFEDSTDDPHAALFRINTSGVQQTTFTPQADSGGASWTTGYLLADGTGTWVAQIDVNGVVSNQILLLNSAHTIVRRISVPFSPFLFTKGSDGNLWVPIPGNIARIDASNGITQFAASFSGGITSGPDGAIWFGESSLNRIGRMNTSGVVTNEFPIPTASSMPRSMTSGPGGVVWFTEIAAPPRLARITTAGVVTECPLPDTPVGSSYGSDITAGPDGAVWFTGIGASNRVKVYRYMP